MNGKPGLEPESEMLILVDEQDNEVGTLPKIECHLGAGTLHRAFSVFLFDPEGRLLIQKRAPGKMLWGGYWANSCCSHPRKNEAILDAAHRRTREELGVVCDLAYLYKFVYRARFGNVGSEYENCSVFVGHFDGKVRGNPLEVSATRCVAPDELSADLRNKAEMYTPWFKLEWERIEKEFLDNLLSTVFLRNT